MSKQQTFGLLKMAILDDYKLCNNEHRGTAVLRNTCANETQINSLFV